MNRIRPHAAMMKRFPSKLAVSILFLVVPFALFSAQRDTASWQPEKIADISDRDTLALSPNERLIAHASRDKSGLVTVRDLERGKDVQRHIFQYLIFALAFSPDSRSIAIAWRDMASDGGTKRVGLSLWGLTGKPRNLVVPRTGTSDWPRQVRFSPDGQTIWLASTDNLRSWEVASGRMKSQWRRGGMERDSSLPFFSAVSKDCRRYFRSDAQGYSVWDTTSGKQLLETNLPFLADADVDFSPDASLATYFAEAPKDNYYPVISTSTGQVLWQSPSEVILAGDKAIRRNETPRGETLEIKSAQTGEVLRTLTAPAKARLLSFESQQWLYSINEKGELFRQRLQ